MAILRWTLLAAAIFLGFAIARIPASYAGYFMTQNTGVGLTGLSGTLWQGRASMASIHIDGRDYSLGELSWEIQPLSLLKLAPCAEITTRLERQQFEGTACASAGGTLRLENANLNAPASLVTNIAPGAKLDGQLSARVEQLALKGQTLQTLDGNLSWTGARVHNGRQWLNVGAFAAELGATDQGAIAADVFTLEGPIDLNGRVIMPLTGGININGTFALTDDFADEVQAEQWLPMVATPTGDGRHQIEMQL